MKDIGNYLAVTRTGRKVLEAFDAPFDHAGAWEKRFQSAIDNLRAAVKALDRQERA